MINTHVDSIHVNTPPGWSYICKLIGQLFGFGLRKNVPPVTTQMRAHVEAGDELNIVDGRGITNNKEHFVSKIQLQFKFPAW